MKPDQPVKRIRKRVGPITTYKAGLIGLVLIIVFSYLGLTKFKIPFVSSKTTVEAMFLNANQLRPGALVRIGGVNVGQVKSISPPPNCQSAEPAKCQSALVTMQVTDQGLPLHKDATFTIRPRIFLEGNFFVDIRPGSPSAPLADSSYVFPVQQGAQPVQFDQVLTSLQSDTRRNLQILLKQYGTGVKQGGPSYNRSIQYWLPAYKYSSVVEHDMLGQQPHDLSNWIDKQGTVSGAIDRHPQSLQNLVTDFNTTAHAFAVQNVALQQAVGELPKTLAAAIPTFNALNSDFCAGPHVPNCAPGPLPTLAKALIPGTKSTGPMVDASLPFLNQLRLLMQPSELQGLAKDLSVTVPALARLTVATIPFMRNGVRPASSCVANVIYPWSQLTLNDPHFNASNGFPPHKVYVEGVDFLPGLAGESRNFDANGPYIRILGALGQTGVTSVQPGLVGGTLAPLAGFQPTLPPGGSRPPLQPNVPCETQPPIRDLTAGSQAAPVPATASTSPGSLGLIPLPLGLSSDKGGAGQAPLHPSPQQLAAARQKLMQQGAFEIVKQPRPATSARASRSVSTGKRSKRARAAKASR